MMPEPPGESSTITPTTPITAPSDRAAPDALARQRPVADDPQRGRRCQHGGQIRRRVGLGDRDDADAAAQHPDADDRRAAELARARAARRGARARPARRASSAPASRKRTPAATSGCIVSTRHADRQVGRAPHEVEEPHRQQHAVRASAYLRRLAPARAPMGEDESVSANPAVLVVQHDLDRRWPRSSRRSRRWACAPSPGMRSRSPSRPPDRSTV